MSRTVYCTATTLDGFIADENDSLAWLFKQDQDEQGPMNYDDFRAATVRAAVRPPPDLAGPQRRLPVCAVRPARPARGVIRRTVQR